MSYFQIHLKTDYFRVKFKDMFAYISSAWLACLRPKIRATDPDPDTDRNESTNVPISKLRNETKPKHFDVFQNPKWNISIYSKIFGTKPKLFDVFQHTLSKSITLLFNSET